MIICTPVLNKLISSVAANAVRKPSISRRSTHRSVSSNMNALMTSENSPSVIKVSGSVRRLMILPMIALISPKTAAINSRAKKPPLTSIPGSSHAVRPMAIAIANQVHKNLRTSTSSGTGPAGASPVRGDSQRCTEWFFVLMVAVNAPIETESYSADVGVIPVLLKVGRVLVFIIYAIVVIDVVLLLMSFFLMLFGASTDASFTQWVYRSSARAMEPFRGIFPTHALSDTAVLDTSVLFAAMIYSFLALGFHMLYEWFGRLILRRRRG